jgi:hypothetical protein
MRQMYYDFVKNPYEKRPDKLLTAIYTSTLANHERYISKLSPSLFLIYKGDVGYHRYYLPGELQSKKETNREILSHIESIHNPPLEIFGD